MRRVLILSDHPLFGRCVECLLHAQMGVEVVGRETSADEAITRIKELQPDWVIVDSGVSERDATAVLRVLQAGSGCKVIALSRHDNTMSIYRGEQRVVHDTVDLLAVIDADPPATGQAPNTPVALTRGGEGGRQAELRSRAGSLDTVDTVTRQRRSAILGRKGISRRDFVKGALVTGGAAAASTMLGGCQSAAPETADIPSKWDKEVEVLAVGSGVGLAAAVEAATAGADVLVIEKGDHIGGLWLTAGGSCTMGGNNVVQQRAGEQDDLETWYQDEMYANEYRGQPEIMRTLVERGAETVKWMEDLGMVWDDLQAGVLRPPIKRGIRPAQAPGVYAGGYGTPNSGICWVQVWDKKLKELGVPVLLKHKMTRLYREEDGPVVGAEVETEDGTINIKATKAVILCSGTWTDNYRMAQAWDPRIVGPDCYGDGGTPTDGTLYVDSAGDGHLAAAAVGAGFSDMSFVSYIYIFFGARSYWGWGEEPIDWTDNTNYASGKGLPRTEDFYQRVILVKNDGTRYINEAEGAAPRVPGRSSLTEWPEWTYTATYLSLPQPRNVWAVADVDTAAALEWPIEALQNPNPKVGQMYDPECVAIADTLDELASKMGVPADELKATVEKYNGFVDAGEDADFGKPMPLFKIAKPPFYAAKASVIRHTQRNGLRVNTKSQVLEQSDQRDGYDGVSSDKSISIDDEKVIPHLYAAGECGDALGWRRPHNSLGHYTTAARIAAENAVKETPLK